MKESADCLYPLQFKLFLKKTELLDYMNEDEIQVLLDEYQDGVITYDNASKLAEAIKLKDQFSKLIMSELAIRGFVSQALSYSSPETFLKSFWERYHAEKTDEEFLKKFETKNSDEIQEKMNELKSSDSHRREKAWNINVADNETSKKRGQRIINPQAFKIMVVLGIIAVVLISVILFAPSLFKGKPLGNLIYLSRGFQILQNGELKDGYGQKYFYKKDRITTSKSSTIDLVYNKGATISLAENSRVYIELNEKLTNNILRNAVHRIDIDLGSIDFQINVSSGPFLLSTPQGKILIRDGDGRVTVNSNATMIEIKRNQGSFYQKETSEPVNVSKGSSFFINSEGQIQNKKIKTLKKGESNE